jgi:hypothetical protein
MKNHRLVFTLNLISVSLLCEQECKVEPKNPTINQEFKVTIPTHRLTGYDWYFKGIVKQISPTNIMIPLDHPCVKPYGAPEFTVTHEPSGNKETKTFTFIARKAARITLRFEQKHRYKTGVKVRASKDINVDIKEK